MGTVHSSCYQKNILPSASLGNILSVFLLWADVPSAFWNYFNAQDGKNRKSKEKDRHKFLWQRNCVWAWVDISIFNLFYPCARFGVRQCGDSLLSHPKNSIANSSSISVGEWTQKSLWLNSNTLLAHSMNSVHLIWLCSVFLHIRWLLFVKKLCTVEHTSDRLCISFLGTNKLPYSQCLKQQELHIFQFWRESREEHFGGQKSEIGVAGVKSRWWQVKLPPEALGKTQLASSQWLPDALTCGCITPIFKSSIFHPFSTPSSHRLPLLMCQIFSCHLLTQICII